METEEQIKLDIPKGYEFAGVDDATQQVILKRIEPQYPKTFEECCEVLDVDFIDNDVKGYLQELLYIFQQLLICRDAYWKLAGDWKPDWTNNIQDKHVISTLHGKIASTVTRNKYILSFPTVEMRVEFYKNFKDLIELCKELI